jgi:hypothetical protein
VSTAASLSAPDESLTYVLVIMTDGQPSLEYGIETVETIAAPLNRSLLPPPLEPFLSCSSSRSTADLHWMLRRRHPWKPWISPTAINCRHLTTRKARPRLHQPVKQRYPDLAPSLRERYPGFKAGSAPANPSHRRVQSK